MSPSLRQPLLASRLQGFGTTIFAEMSALAVRTGAINLGQGFPDTDGPAEVAEAAIAAIRAGHNQYPPGPGIPELRQAIAAHQKRFWGLDVDPDTEVLVTAGATEAIAAALLALCETGDEVRRLRADLRLVPRRRVDGRGHAAGGDPRAARLLGATSSALAGGGHAPHPPAAGQLAAQPHRQGASRRTSWPPSPSLCVAHDLIAVTDEVYEHLVFDGVHRAAGHASRAWPSARSPISSAGKTFSFTGWKIGWACGPAPLVAAVRTAKQFLTYVNGAPFQPAVAVGLGLDDAYFAGLRDGLRPSATCCATGLEAAGFAVHPAGRHLLRHRRHPPAGRRRRPRVLPVAARALRRGRRAQPVFYEDPEPGPAPGALRLLQAARGAGRGGVPAGHAVLTSHARVATGGRTGALT